MDVTMTPAEVLQSKVDKKLGEVDIQTQIIHNSTLEQFTYNRQHISAAGEPGDSERLEGGNTGKIKYISHALGAMLKGHTPNILDPELGNNNGGWFDFATVWQCLQTAAEQKLKRLCEDDVQSMLPFVECIETSFSASAQITRFELKKDEMDTAGYHFWLIRATGQHNRSTMRNVDQKALPTPGRTEAEYRAAKERERRRIRGTPRGHIDPTYRQANHRHRHNRNRQRSRSPLPTNYRRQRFRSRSRSRSRTPLRSTMGDGTAKDRNRICAICGKPGVKPTHGFCPFCGNAYSR